MKKLFNFIYLFPVLALGQSPSYVRTTTYKQANTQSVSNPDAATATVQTTYFDGLGRPIQQRSHQQSGTGKDIVTHMDYDAYGRQPKEYLPFASDPNLSYNSNAENEVYSFYGSADPVTTGNPRFEPTNNPFSEKRFEASPLNRVLLQAAPGDEWRMDNLKEIKMGYLLNNTDEVRLFRATAAWDASQGYYSISLDQDGSLYHLAGKIYKTVMKDENWTSSAPLKGITEEFKDKLGRQVLKRTYGESFVNGTPLANQKHDTYYVYDQYGNLTYVIPPKADGTITQSVLDNLCYQYRYDKRNRLVEKKLPGKQWEFIIYDRLDRVVATGPALSPFSDITKTGWLITKHDSFNRNVLSGWMEHDGINSVTRNLLQENLNDQLEASTISISESRTLQFTNMNSVTYGYTNVAFPTSKFHVLTVNYYDDYGFPNGPADFEPIEGQSVYYNLTLKPKGMSVGSWVRALETSTAIAGETSYTLYDKKGRVLRTSLTNYLGGYNITDNKIDAFSGQVDYTVTRQKRSNGRGETELYVKDIYSYNDQDRLILHLHQIGTNGVPQLLAKNEYDELGQLIVKKVGGLDQTAATYYQKVDYSYTVRGWLKAINDANRFEQQDDGTDLFALKINYNTVENNFNGQIAPQHNGNIAEMFWKSKSDGHLRSYSYGYDALNRLRMGIYHKENKATRSYDELMSYDKNGNIMNLKRNGDLDVENFLIEIDDLDYTYDEGNRLKKVEDNTIHPAGFRDQAHTPEEYFYDANGNLTKDENKNITISYNHLNLPVEIIFRDGTGKINYLYDASGKKLKKTVTQGTTVTITDYLSGFQYLSGILDFFPTAEGYVKAVSYHGGKTSFEYVFNFTDHLGNIRMSYGYDAASGNVIIMEENHNYPFGMKHEKYNSDQYEYVPTEEGSQYPVGISPLGPTNRKSYQYKYNSKEWQDELGLNFYDYGARNYDPALGRWMNMDVLSEKYPNVSSYVYVSNMPTIAIDPDGNEIILVTSSGVKLQYKNGNAYYYGTNRKYSANGNTTIDRVIRSYQKIETFNDKILTRTLHRLERSDLKHTIYESTQGANSVYPAQGSTFMDGSNDRTGTDSYFDLSKERKDALEKTNGVPFTDLDIVSHEMGHQYDYDLGNMADSDVPSNEKSPTEIRAVFFENIARDKEGNKKRTKYGGEIDPKLLDNPTNFFPPIDFSEKRPESIFLVNFNKSRPDVFDQKDPNGN